MSSIRDQTEAAIRNMPDNHCRPGQPEDLTLPLCEHRAYNALCKAIESLKAKGPDPNIPDEHFIFSTDEAFAEMQNLYSLEIVREITFVMAEYFGLPPCDCGVRDEESGELVDPYLCGGVFAKVLNQIFTYPPEM